MEENKIFQNETEYANDFGKIFVAQTGPWCAGYGTKKQSVLMAAITVCSVILSTQTNP
jgi:hypothetical protein